MARTPLVLVRGQRLPLPLRRSDLGHRDIVGPGWVAAICAARLSHPGGVGSLHAWCGLCGNGDCIRLLKAAGYRVAVVVIVPECATATIGLFLMGAFHCDYVHGHLMDARRSVAAAHLWNEWRSPYGLSSASAVSRAPNTPTLARVRQPILCHASPVLSDRSQPDKALANLLRSGPAKDRNTYAPWSGVHFRSYSGATVVRS